MPKIYIQKVFINVTTTVSNIIHHQVTLDYDNESFF